MGAVLFALNIIVLNTKGAAITDARQRYQKAYESAKTKHLTALLDRINVNAIESTISEIRGIRCHIPELDQAARVELVSGQMGGQNCHIDAEFEDGVTWIVRIRLADPTLPPQEVQNYIFLSEVATLKFLAWTSVPVPEVYHYQLDSVDNPIGASFMVMEKIGGRALDWDKANNEQGKKIMEQLATIFLELEKYPFEKTGSIVLAGPELAIGGFAQLPMFETPTLPLGPWTNLDDAYTAIIRQQLHFIDSHEITSLPDENRHFLQWQVSVLPSLLSSTNTRNGPFYLKHFDDKGDHILVDEQYNITGIIDWEFASTEAKGLAFSAPCMMWPVGDYYDGSNVLSPVEVTFARIFEERNRQDMANIVLNGRPSQRFLFFLGGLPRDKEEFNGLFRGLQSSFATMMDG